MTATHREIRLGNFLEFWKLFRTGQFIHYAALAEDWFENTSQPVGPPPDVIQPNTRLSFEEAIYRVAEIYEFLARLVGAGLYEGSVGVRIELHNLKGREIWIQSRHRGHFPHPQHHRPGSEVVLDERLEVGKVVANPSAFAAAHLQRIFRSFGFSPSLEQMNAEVERARSVVPTTNWFPLAPECPVASNNAAPGWLRKYRHMVYTNARNWILPIEPGHPLPRREGGQRTWYPPIRPPLRTRPVGYKSGTWRRPGRSSLEVSECR